MKIIHYCQHVLGMGHVFRSMEIAREMTPDKVWFITGGPKIYVSMPDNVTHHPMPGIAMSDDFSEMFPTDKSRSLEEVQEERRASLLELLEEVRPDVIMVELFPFGRRAFSFELVPLLKAARAMDKPAKTVVSVRDILVEKADQALYEKRVFKKLNKLFDLVLVHSDPELIRFEETFPRIDEIRPELEYTGYVARKPAPDSRERVRGELGLDHDTPLVAISAGGGKIGELLIGSAAKALAVLARSRDVAAVVSTGPFMDDQAFERVKNSLAGLDKVRVTRFVDDFPSLMAAADLSVNMGGYNTTMDVLASGVRCLALPFAQNREQAMRLERLEGMNIVTRLSPDDLGSERLSALMAAELDDSSNTSHGVDLDGARATARIIKDL